MPSLNFKTCVYVFERINTFDSANDRKVFSFSSIVFGRSFSAIWVRDTKYRERILIRIQISPGGSVKIVSSSPRKLEDFENLNP